jgi:hypothetical protein
MQLIISNIHELKSLVCHELNAKTATPVVKCVSCPVKNARWSHHDRALAGGPPIVTDVV